MDDTELVFRSQQSSVFRITIEGELDERWADYFDTQSISVGAGKSGEPITVLVSKSIDQAALVGLINRLNGLRINLLSVEMQD